MAITGLNHITLATADLDRAVAFYTGVLDARLAASWPRGAYLELGDIWLCLAAGNVTPRTDYTHIALNCAKADFPALAARIAASANLWQDNSSEGASLYFLDPDGHRLELHCGTLASRLAYYAADPKSDVTILAP